METKQTKSGKTMYGTKHEGKEYWSLEQGAVEALEKGELDKVTLTEKENINFVGFKNGNRTKSFPVSGRPSVKETVRLLTEANEILRKLIDGLKK